MAVTYHFYLRKDKARDSGECPVYLRITENRKSKYVSTGVYIKPKYWNPEKEEVRKNHRSKGSLQNKLDKKKDRAQRVEAELSKYDKDSAKAIQERLKKQETGDFFDLADKYEQELQDRKKLYAIKTLNVVLNKLEDFEGERSLPLRHIDTKYLERFEGFLKRKYNNRSTTINKNFEPIRAIIKRALENHLIHIDPFANFEGAKRGKPQPKTKLSIEQIREIENFGFEKGSNLWHARNYFMFSFYSGGIRFGDLCCLKWNDITGNRLSYQMNKNEKVFTIELNKYQLRILFQYIDDTQLTIGSWQPSSDYFLKKGFSINGELTAMLTRTINDYAKKVSHDFIFPILNNHKDYSDPIFLRKRIGSKNALINKWLGTIIDKVNAKLEKQKSDIPKLEDVSFHVARHSFAQHAVQQGLSMYELMQTLRHSKIETTQKYLKGLDEQLADKAMKKVF